MQHERFCDTKFHVDYGDGSDPGPCKSEAVQSGQVLAYLVQTELGPKWSIQVPERLLIPVRECADWMRRMNDLAVLAQA